MPQLNGSECHHRRVNSLRDIGCLDSGTGIRWIFSHPPQRQVKAYVSENDIATASSESPRLVSALRLAMCFRRSREVPVEGRIGPYEPCFSATSIRAISRRILTLSVPFLFPRAGPLGCVLDWYII